MTVANVSMLRSDATRSLTAKMDRTKGKKTAVSVIVWSINDTESCFTAFPEQTLQIYVCGCTISHSYVPVRGCFVVKFRFVYVVKFRFVYAVKFSSASGSFYIFGRLKCFLQASGDACAIPCPLL